MGAGHKRRDKGAGSAGNLQARNRRVQYAVAIVVAGCSAALLWLFPLPAWLDNRIGSASAPSPDALLDPSLRTSGPLSQTVFERNLVSRRLSARTVVAEHGGFHFNVSRRLSPGLCLGFVAPWSRRGDEVTWRFGSKLTHLSPIMFGVDAAGSLKLLEKPRWLTTLRDGLACPACPPPARIVPHVSLAGLDFATFFADDAEHEERAGRLLLALLQQYVTLKLDGLVLDAHQHLARLSRDERRIVAPRLHIFVQLLAQQLSMQEREHSDSAAKRATKSGSDAKSAKSGSDATSTSGSTSGSDASDAKSASVAEGASDATSASDAESSKDADGTADADVDGGELLLLVPPHPELFSPTQYAQLAAALSGVVVSTANFSSVRGTPGPSAPLKWMIAALRALEPTPEAMPRMMASLSLHGWDFELDGQPANGAGGKGQQSSGADGKQTVAARAIDGDEYVALLAAHRPRTIEWKADAHEHVFSYTAAEGGRAHSVYYPSLKSLQERLMVLRELGLGVALWELGSGLDYWWDLL